MLCVKELKIKPYYEDKRILLPNYWAYPEHFENFIRMIDKNLLFVDDLELICKRINNDYVECHFTKCKEGNCDYHPFSMLEQLGLLGIISQNGNIKNNISQKFRDSSQITYYCDEAKLFSRDDEIFVIHPALTKCIEKNIPGGSIMHFRGFILGKGLSVSDEQFFQLLSDKKKMTKSEFEKKYYSKKTF